MSHAIPDLQMTQYRGNPGRLLRYVSVCPRTAVYTARVNGAVTKDSVSNGIVAITYDGGSGSLSDILLDYTLDVGTAPGLHDVGKLRIRKAPTSTIFYVSETAAGKANVQDDHYLTVVQEFRPFQVMPRIVQSGSGANASYTEYHDYDIAYSNQNSAIRPVPIIERAAQRPAIPAGWVDEDGYRDVILTSTNSWTPVGTITGREWNIADGSYLEGSSSSTSIVARFNISGGVFRYISLTVENSTGAQWTLHFPIWLHDADHPPLTATITRDDYDGNGWMRELQFGGSGVNVDRLHLPEGAPVCVWLDAELAGTPAPDTYLGQFLGWSVSDASDLKKYQSRYRVTLGGVAYWAAKLRSFEQILYDPGETPDTLHEMQNITVDKAILYALWRYSTLLRFCNIFPSGSTGRAKDITLKNTTLWAQIADLATAAEYGVVGADKLNGIWVRRHFSYQSADNRTARGVVANLTWSDWTDAQGLVIPEDKIEEYGFVDAYGSIWNGAGDPMIFRSNAPGLTPSYGSNSDDAPFQYLPSVGQQWLLNDLTGHRWAALNNPRKQVTLRLIGDYDFIEPAWNEPITLTWVSANPRGTVLNQANFLVRRIQIRHSATGKPKDITWTLEQETGNWPGETADIEINTTPLPPVTPPVTQPPYVPDLTGTGLFFIGAGKRAVWSRNVNTVMPHWVSQTLSSMSGTVLSWAQDASTPSEGRVVTTSHIYKIAGIGTTNLIVTQQHTFATTNPDSRFIQTERGLPGWWCCFNYYDGVGMQVTWTADGENWHEGAQFGGYATGGSVIQHANGYMSPHTGQVWSMTYQSGTSFYGVQRLWRSDNLGATFALDAAYGSPYTGRPPTWLERPYDDPSYFMVVGIINVDGVVNNQRIYKLSTGGTTNVSPVVGGVTYGARRGRAWRAHDTDSRKQVMIAYPNNQANQPLGVFRSFTRGDTWEVVIPPASGNAGKYEAAAIAGDGNTVILWGNSKVYISTDFLNSIRDATGDLTGSDLLLNVAGIG